MQSPTAFYTRYPSQMLPSTPSLSASQPAPHPSAQQHYAHPHSHSHSPYQHPQASAPPSHPYVYSPYAQAPYVSVMSVQQPPPPQYSQMPSVHVLSPYVQRTQQLAAPIPPSHVPQSFVLPVPKETPERDAFYAKLHAFRDEIGEPIQRLPTLGFKELDLWVLYKEVIKRRGIDSVIAKKQWKEVAEALQLPSSCTDSGFRLRLHYKKYLEAFERKFYKPLPSKDSAKPEKKPGRLSSSSMSVASAITDIDGENESAGSSGSRRSSSPVPSSEATSKDKCTVRPSDIRKSRGIAKRKRRSPLSSVPVKAVSLSNDEAKVRHSPSVVPDSEDAEMKTCDGRDGGKGARDGGKGAREGEKEHLSSDTHALRLRESSSRPQSSERGAGERLSVPSDFDVAKGEAKQNVRHVEKASSDNCPHNNLSMLEAAAAVVDEKRRAPKRNRTVDFSVLDDSTLERYARTYRVSDTDVGNESGPSKKELAASVSAHFSATPLADGEHETLLKFIHAVRRG